MTGRYLIYTPADSVRDERRFVEVCRSLHRDRLTYDVQLNLAGDNPHVLALANGTAKARKHPVSRAVVLPPPCARATLPGPDGRGGVVPAGEPLPAE